MTSVEAASGATWQGVDGTVDGRTDGWLIRRDEALEPVRLVVLSKKKLKTYVAHIPQKERTNTQLMKQGVPRVSVYVCPTPWSHWQDGVANSCENCFCTSWLARFSNSP